MPVEESGNMLIMTLSHARETGDNSLITNYVRTSPSLLRSIPVADTTALHRIVQPARPMDAVPH